VDTLVDSNVILDLVTADARWAGWSEQAMRASALRGRLLINDVIYAELAPAYARIESLDAALAELRLVHAPMPRAALFLASRAFAAYRRRGGTRTGVLPDFFVGAHAAVGGLSLLSRDAGRYRGSFPSIALVTPGG
jgi:predicted nucleic acid-binding protein